MCTAWYCARPALLEIVLCPADFTRMKHIFKCNNVYINNKIRHHSSKDTGCLNKKDWGWFWQWWRWKPHLLKTAKKTLVRCMLFIFSCSSKIYIFVHIFFGLLAWNIYVDKICISANTHRLSPVAVRLIKRLIFRHNGLLFCICLCPQCT